jgi:hypothetical protein
MEFQAYIPKIHSNNGMLKWNLRNSLKFHFKLEMLYLFSIGILEKFRVVSTTNVKNNNFKINVSVNLKFKIITKFKFKLGNQP